MKSFPAMPEETQSTTEASILRGVAAVYAIGGVIAGLVIWSKWGTTSSYSTRLQDEAAALWVIVAIATIAQGIMLGSIMYALAAICDHTAAIATRAKLKASVARSASGE